MRVVERYLLNYQEEPKTKLGKKYEPGKSKPQQSHHEQLTTNASQANPPKKAESIVGPLDAKVNSYQYE